MAVETTIHVLAAVPAAGAGAYQHSLGQDPLIALTLVHSVAEARAYLAESQHYVDVLVLDQGLGGGYALVRELRQTYPRLLIILVDQAADFGMPGQADEVTVQPFADDDLLRRIKRLIEERRLETLPADAFPSVRQFAKALQRAGPGQAKAQAAVGAIAVLGYDYVAFYSVLPTTPPELVLSAQAGPESVLPLAPTRQAYAGTLLGWVVQNGQSRLVGPEDEPNHPFVQQGRYRSGVCVPVGRALPAGVIFACRAQPGAITQQNVMMLEVVSAQLASALARQVR